MPKTLDTLGRSNTGKLGAKLDPGVGLQFEELRASDLAGRARAYKQLTEAGIEATEARAICGF